MGLSELYPSSTSICDFAYEEYHPLRHGQCSDSNKDSEADESEYTERSSPNEISEDATPLSLKVMNLRAVALFDFTPENDNEIELKEGQSIWISYRHGQGWLVAEDPHLGKNGLVPEEYVDFLVDEEDFEDVPKPFMPQLLRQLDEQNDNEWEDLDDEIPNDLDLQLLQDVDTDINALKHHLNRIGIDDS